MEGGPTYQEIKSDLEEAIAQAYALATEEERQDFVVSAARHLGTNGRERPILLPLTLSYGSKGWTWIFAVSKK
jgi:hypothetical protein